MSEETNGDEISLIDLFAVFLRRKVMIIVIALIIMMGISIKTGLKKRTPPANSSCWMSLNITDFPHLRIPVSIFMINPQTFIERKHEYKKT